MSLEKKMQKLDKLVNKLSDNKLNYQERMKKYMKCKLSIDKCRKELEGLESNINSEPKKVKYNSLSIIEKKIENSDDIENMNLSELIDLYHSTNKIVNDIEIDLTSINKK